MYTKRGINQPAPADSTDLNDAEPDKLYQAAAIMDGAGLFQAPGAVRMRGAQVLAAGAPEIVSQAVAGRPVQRIDLPGYLLLPGLVNAHTHLNLTDIGPKPLEGSFIDWIGMVIANRPAHPADSTAGGEELSRLAGVLTAGDIADAVAEPSSDTFRGVRFAEFFGLTGETLADSKARMADYIAEASKINEASMRIGLQPHAPYSTGPELYRLAAATDLPLSTHLAETPEELEFVAHATGPFRDLLERMGKWDPKIAADNSASLHPIEWLAQYVDRHILCAHCNYVDDAHIDRLAALGWSIAYCPRASDYFGHRNHRYRDMLAAGVNVCLGTDSIICHGSLSILDEMRHLYQRDGVNPALLLKMATVNGARAVEMPESDVCLTPGSTPGLLAIRYDGDATSHPLAAILRSNDPIEVQVLEDRR
jgi:cytosine/adenosine deaminase-related metal-dependent hydrolase